MKGRPGTYEDEFDTIYNYEYNHNKDFHIKRKERGKELQKNDKLKIALYSALTGVLGAGAVVFGIDAFANPELLGAGVIESTIASMAAVGSAIGVAKKGIIDNVKHLLEVKEEMADSDKMINQITEDEEFKKGM